MTGYRSVGEDKCLHTKTSQSYPQVLETHLVETWFRISHTLRSLVSRSCFEGFMTCTDTSKFSYPTHRAIGSIAVGAALERFAGAAQRRPCFEESNLCLGQSIGSNAGLCASVIQKGLPKAESAIWPWVKTQNSMLPLNIRFNPH